MTIQSNEKSTNFIKNVFLYEIGKLKLINSQYEFRQNFLI